MRSVDISIVCAPLSLFGHTSRSSGRFSFETSTYMPCFSLLKALGVIPVQSFRSHIRPQPPGLGLRPTQDIMTIPYAYCTVQPCTERRRNGTDVSQEIQLSLRGKRTIDGIGVTHKVGVR